MRGAAPVLLVASLLAACGAPAAGPSSGTSERSTPDTRLSNHSVYRPELHFADGRTQMAGVAFVLDAGDGRRFVATSGHLARNLRKGSDLKQITLLNNQSGSADGVVSTLAGSPGATFDGLDYSTDVALLNAPGLADAGSPFVPARGNARVGDEVEIVACPADRSARDVRLRGRVEGSDGSLLRVRLDSAVDARGFAGAPIVLVQTGELAGMVQTVSGGVALATPATAIQRFADGGGKAPIPVSDWK
ncbi:MAG TPA: hypothetical protein PLF26_10695 [Blastocatellia bacterium]|nr:hypothetical protein [Blastocatellia bacterium]